MTERSTDLYDPGSTLAKPKLLRCPPVPRGRGAVRSDGQPVADGMQLLLRRYGLVPKRGRGGDRVAERMVEEQREGTKEMRPPAVPDHSAQASAAPGGLPFGTITLFIPGKPQPGGSKRAFMPKGWTRPVITDANPLAVDWKRTAQAFALDAMAGKRLADGPLKVSMTFLLARPQGHFGARGLRPSAPSFPATKPDVLKLARSTEDALTGIVWVDDARIVEEHLAKVYAPDGKTGAVIEVEKIR